jgi:hypothetical protein
MVKRAAASSTEMQRWVESETLSDPPVVMVQKQFPRPLGKFSALSSINRCCRRSECEKYSGASRCENLGAEIHQMAHGLVGSVLANAHNHFNRERHLVDRQTYKEGCSAA